MGKAKKLLSITLAFLFTLALFNPNVFAATKVAKPKVVVSVQPKTTYTVGDRISFSVKAPNYKGKVIYRVNIRNASGQIVRELWPSLPGKYYNKQISALGSFSIATSIKEPGTYFFVVYVKRPNAKGYYETYALTRKFVVKDKVVIEEPEEEPKDVVLDKEGQVYNAEGKTIEKDVYLSANNTILSNAKVAGTIYVDPGVNGNATLDNVEAEKVVVLSGGENSIHFKSLKAKEVSVDAKAKVRVVSEGTTSIVSTKILSEVLVDNKAGSFGTVSIEPKAEGKKVELKGAFDVVKVLTSVSVKSIDAVVQKVEISTEKSDAKVVLDGQFKAVEAIKPVVIEIATGKVEKIEVKAKVEITVSKDATVTELNKNGNEVTVDNKGTVEKIDGVVQGSTGGSTGGGTTTPEYKALDDFMAKLMADAIAVKNEHSAIYSLYVNSIDYANRTLTINLKSAAGAETPSSLYSKLITRIQNGYHQDLTANNTSLLDDFLGTSGLLNNVRLTATGFNNVTLKTYAVNKLSGHTALVNFINNPNEANYDAVRAIMASENYDSFAEALVFIHALIPGDDVTIDSMSVYGLSVSEVSIDSTKIFGGEDKTISIAEIRSALGVTGSVGVTTLAQVLGQDKTMTMTLKLQGANGIYTYNVVINLQ